MSRNMWIPVGLMTISSLVMIYRGETGIPVPDHVKCKASLVIQIFAGTCTERSSIAGNASVMNGDTN